jgi:hypothetical protein
MTDQREATGDADVIEPAATLPMLVTETTGVHVSGPAPAPILENLHAFGSRP